MMTDNTTTNVLPIGIRPLDPDHVACRACGTPCGADAPRQTFAIRAKADHHLGIVDAGGEVTFGLCPACLDLEEHAARTLDAHPAIRHRIGSPSIGRHRLVSAFHGLAVVGADPKPTYTQEHLLSLLYRLTDPGAMADWSRSFVPVWLEDASRDTASTEPWSHVGLELRAAIGHGYGLHLADRMPPVEHRCPTRGCAWCGVPSITALRTAKPWTPLSISPASLGGRGPKAISVHLCPTCERIRADGGKMTDSLLAAADPDRAIRRHHAEAPVLDGVRGWAVTGLTANREPWSHLLDDARRALSSGDW